MKDKMCLRLVAFCATLCCASLVSIGAIYEKAGFYVGLSAGSGYNAGNFRGNAASDEGTFDIRNKISTCGFEKGGCGFVGYMTHLSCEGWLAGVELGIEKPFYKKHFKTTIYDELAPLFENCQYKIKTMYVAKLHAKAGKILNDDWFVYGLVGVDMKKTEISMQQETTEMKGKKSLWGIAVGLGVEREMGKSWRLGLECVNTYYPRRTLKGIEPEGNVRFTSRLKTNSTQVSLRLIYNF